MDCAQYRRGIRHLAILCDASLCVYCTSCLRYVRQTCRRFPVYLDLLGCARNYQAHRAFFFIFVCCCSFFFLLVAAHLYLFFFFLNNPAPPEISPLPLHAALPI